MKTKIGTSFGLVLLLAIGVLATALALGIFTSSKVNADHPNTTDPVQISSIAMVPSGAGSNSQVTIKFSTGHVLNAGSDQIILEFDAHIGIPSSIAKERISITEGTTGGTSNPSVDPSTLSVTPNSAFVPYGVGFVRVVLFHTRP